MNEVNKTLYIPLYGKAQVSKQNRILKDPTAERIWAALTPEYIVSFLTGNVLRLLGMGCLFQFIKEKTETLWTAILLHAILDFMIIFGL